MCLQGKAKTRLELTVFNAQPTGTVISRRSRQDDFVFADVVPTTYANGTMLPVRLSAD